MKDGRFFLPFWIVNSVLLYFTPYVFPDFLVVGNARLTAFMAAVVSGFMIALACAAVLPVFTWMKIKLNDEWQKMFAFLFINVLSVWFIGRYADLTGVGIASAWIAVVMGLVLYLGQWLAMMGMDNKLK